MPIRRIVLALVIVGVVAALGLTARVILAPETVTLAVVDAGTESAANVDAGPAPLEIIVVKVSGTGEVRRAGSETWKPVELGDKLKADDTIRTGPDSSMAIDAGGHVIELQEGTDVRVAELTESLTKYLLGSGFIAADAKPGTGASDRRLEVGVEGTDVAVGATDGRFQMTSNGAGTVAVAAQRGDVKVAAAGKAVVLQPGERTLVLPNKPPSEPEAVSSALLLKVSWPAERETNRRVVTVQGRTEAGALVFAMGRPAKVDADGRFSAKVTLNEGQNSLELTARDASGNVVKQGGPRIVVDTKGAASKFRTDDLWKQKETPGPR